MCSAVFVLISSLTIWTLSKKKQCSCLNFLSEILSKEEKNLKKIQKCNNLALPCLDHDWKLYFLRFRDNLFNNSLWLLNLHCKNGSSKIGSCNKFYIILQFVYSLADKEREGGGGYEIWYLNATDGMGESNVKAH